MNRIATIVAGIMIGALSLGAAEKAEKIDDQQLTLQAKNARTASEHRAVAGLYQQRAAMFEAKARQHEKQADTMASREGYNPMRHKWPAMAQGSIDRERAKAMQARRAARESLELMARHYKLAGSVTAGE